MYGASAAMYGSAATALLQNWLNHESSYRQYKYNLRMLKNGPSAQIAGYKKAGMNPILYMGNGASSLPSISMAGGSVPDLGSNLVGGISADNQREQTDLNRHAVESAVRLNDVRASQIKQDNLRGWARLAKDFMMDRWNVQRIQAQIGLANAQRDAVIADAGARNADTNTFEFSIPFLLKYIRSWKYAHTYPPEDPAKYTKNPTLPRYNGRANINDYNKPWWLRNQ